MDRVNRSVALVVSRMKDALKNVLGPLLPFIRSIQTIPARINTERYALRFSNDTGISVCYLTSQFPNRPALRKEITHGGAVKLTFLAESFHHSYPKASLLYTVSSVDHVAKAVIVRNARQNGLKIVLNQNGVAYPAWYGEGWEEPNRKMREVYKQANFIIFQSGFCRQGAEKFLGKCTVTSQVIYNPIDLDLYQPANQPAQRRAPTLLLGGNQLAAYRLEVAAQVLNQVIQGIPDSRLIITGKLWGDNQAVSMHEAILLLQKLGISEQVEFTGQYSQNEAVKIFQGADILIHTQFNDASPTLIGEALACGIPVVYSASGGTPELVGPDAGIGIPVENGWEKISTPDPTKMAEAVQLVWRNYKVFREAARQSAEEKFSLKNYIKDHKEIFSSLLEQ